MFIQNNAPAFNVWSSYTANVGHLQNSMTRLSTGKKLSTDNPAGIGISSAMNTQIRNSTAARGNVDNTISMFKTSDAWLERIDTQLGRMSELAIEANGVVDPSAKASLNEEFKQMASEIKRITDGTTAAGKFAGINMFQGETLNIQVGADQGQQISVAMSDLRSTNTADITIDGTTVKWSEVVDNNTMSVSSANTIANLNVAIKHVASERAKFASQQNRFSQTRTGLLSYEDNMRAAEAKISNVDMAQESTNFVKYNILTNSSMSILAQANQLPSNVLQLIG